MRHIANNFSTFKLSFISLTQIAHHKTSLVSYKEDSKYKELNTRKSKKSLANGKKSDVSTFTPQIRKDVESFGKMTNVEGAKDSLSWNNKNTHIF